jgi:hypothetical protein
LKGKLHWTIVALQLGILSQSMWIHMKGNACCKEFASFFVPRVMIAQLQGLQGQDRQTLWMELLRYFPWLWAIVWEDVSLL